MNSLVFAIELDCAYCVVQIEFLNVVLLITLSVYINIIVYTLIKHNVSLGLILWYCKL